MAVHNATLGTCPL